MPLTTRGFLRFAIFLKTVVAAPGMLSGCATPDSCTPCCGADVVEDVVAAPSSAIDALVSEGSA